jgi:ankyrin repeat protein
LREKKIRREKGRVKIKRYINGKRYPIRSIFDCIKKYDYIKLKEYCTYFPNEINEALNDIVQTTPLIFAIRRKNVKAALSLIEMGADITQTNKDNMSALMYAVQIDSYELCEKLISIDKGIVKIESKDWERTALWYAILQLNSQNPNLIDFRIFDLLLENGADIYKPISNKVTPYELITHQKNAKEILMHLENNFLQIMK